MQFYITVNDQFLSCPTQADTVTDLEGSGIGQV